MEIGFFSLTKPQYLQKVTLIPRLSTTPSIMFKIISTVLLYQ